MTRQCFIKTLASMFYIGYIPFMPGTAASILGVMAYIFIQSHYGYLALTLATFLLGIFISSPAEQIFKETDSKKIVIDEVSGMLFTYLFIPFSKGALVTGFLLFRFFDILKPPPLKRLQTLPKGLGIMMDDIGAALYSNLILRLLF